MNAVLRKVVIDKSVVIDLTHPPIAGTVKVKANNGVLSQGLIVSKDSSGELVAWDPSVKDSKIKGVLLHEVDTAKDDSAVIIKHGAVAKAKLLVGSQAPSEQEIEALEDFGIFPL